MKTIIFDLDYTILYLDDEWKQKYNSFVKEHKLPITGEMLYKTIGLFDNNTSDVIITKDMLISYINNNLNINIDINCFEDFLKMYEKIKLIKVDLIKDVLSYLHEKYLIIGYTSWFTENQKNRLKFANLLSYFDEIYGWDVLNKKVSHYAIKKLTEKENKEDFIFIGDSLKLDIELPNSLGYRTIFLNHKNVFNNISEEIKSIEDLLSIL